MHFNLIWHFQAVTVAVTLHDLKTLWSHESLTPKAPDKPHTKYQTFHCFHTRHVQRTYPVQCTYCCVHIYYVFSPYRVCLPSVAPIWTLNPLLFSNYTAMMCKQSTSLNSFCAHWGKKKEKDALEHCNHAENTTEGKRVSSLPSSRSETKYSVYSVTMAFFFNYS